MKQRNIGVKVNPMTMSSAAVRSLFIVGLLLFIITGTILWREVISSPRNVFYGMLDNSLKTRSVARQSLQSSGGQSLDQTTLLQANQYNTARAQTVLTQGSDENATVIKTESIGTPVSDYVRYTDIDTSQQNADGESPDFSNALGVWGRSDSPPGSTSGDLYNSIALGIIPFSYVPPEKRAEILDFIKEKEVYQVDFAKVERKTTDNRQQYVYPVAVSAEDYIGVLKLFTEAVGLNTVDSLNAADFAESPDFQLNITVDVFSRQLVSVAYTGSDQVENYSAHGAWVPVVIPAIEDTITIEELQQRLQTIQ